MSTMVHQYVNYCNQQSGKFVRPILRIQMGQIVFVARMVLNRNLI